MKIYIAARYERRREMTLVAERLEAKGHEVTSRWLDGKSYRAKAADNASYDLTDVLVAECIVLFTEDPSKKVPFAARGGRHVEFGYAIGVNKRLAIVGPRENLFHHLPAVEHFRSVEELVDGLV